MIRVFFSGVRINLLQFSRSPFDLASVLVWPIVYATIAYYLIGAHHDQRTLLGASLGAALMLMWTLVVIGSAGLLDIQRWMGTLELLVAAPAPFVAVVASITVASATFGAYAIVATLLWGRFAFHIPLTITHPLAFAIAIPVSVVSIGLLGLIVASTFVLYRAAISLGVALQYPVWIVCGLLAPLTLLPHFVNVIAWFFAPYWGLQALKDAALGGDPWGAILMCSVVGVGYVVVGSMALRAFVRLARSRGSLKLT